MTLRQADFNWTNLWADLLKGAGTGLLEHDGSRAAQAALAGLKVFDAAQERRRQRGRQGQSQGAHQDMLLKLWSTMRPEEQAAFLRLHPNEQDAYEAELVETETNHEPQAATTYPSNGDGTALTDSPSATTRPLQRGRPISANPFDAWHLQSILPFRSDGALNRPTHRR